MRMGGAGTAHKTVHFGSTKFTTDEVLPDTLTGEEFRRRSDTQKRSYDLQGVGWDADPGQQRCHRIPNGICKDAYNATSDKQIKRELEAFAFSTDNVVFSKHNKTHSKNELAIGRDDAYEAQVLQKQGMIQTALRNAMASQEEGKISAKTLAHLLKTTAAQSDTYERIVADLDRRTLRDSAIKKAINETRLQREAQLRQEAAQAKKDGAAKHAAAQAAAEAKKAAEAKTAAAADAKKAAEAKKAAAAVAKKAAAAAEAKKAAAAEAKKTAAAAEARTAAEAKKAAAADANRATEAAAEKNRRACRAWLEEQVQYDREQEIERVRQQQQTFHHHQHQQTFYPQQDPYRHTTSLHPSMGSVCRPMRMDGTPDMRFFYGPIHNVDHRLSVNRVFGYNMDGSRDGRCGPRGSGGCGGGGGARKMDGTPDMRYKANW